MKSIIEQYRELGLHIFRLKLNSKFPLKGSHGCYDATTNTSILSEWFKPDRRYNFGLATGAVSNLIVLDVDTKNNSDGIATLRGFTEQSFILPPAPQAETPSGGRHLYFSHEPGIGNSVGKLGPGLDIRSDGGQCVAPPSVLSNGSYRWITKPVRPFPKLPRWVVRLLKTGPQSRHNYTSVGDANTDGLVAFVARQHSGRNNSLYWAACRMAEQGKSANEGLAALLGPATQSGLEKPESIKTIESAFKRNSGANED